LENIDRYKSLQENPVVIYLEFCPKTTLGTEEIATMTRAELPQVKSSDNRADRPARAIVLTKAEINCLPKFRPLLERDSELVRLPQDPCASN
jgi:hypothetical protein